MCVVRKRADLELLSPLSRLVDQESAVKDRILPAMSRL